MILKTTACVFASCRLSVSASIDSELRTLQREYASAQRVAKRLQESSAAAAAGEEGAAAPCSMFLEFLPQAEVRRGAAHVCWCGVSRC